MKKCLACLTLLTSLSCTLGPLTAPKSARPLGPGNWKIDNDFNPYPSLNVGRGITDKLDLGFTLEFALGPKTGVWGKYSFKSKRESKDTLGT